MEFVNKKRRKQRQVSLVVCAMTCCTFSRSVHGLLSTESSRRISMQASTKGSDFLHAATRDGMSFENENPLEEIEKGDCRGCQK